MSALTSVAMAPAAALADAVTAPSPMASEREAEGEGRPSAEGGASTHTIPIRAPSVRDGAPAIALSYSSRSGESAAGLGWQISAGGAIRRASDGGGLPRYDSSDIFLLDGERLVPCALGQRMTAACAYPATEPGLIAYVTQRGAPARIARDPGRDQWRVWSTDGTVSTYGRVASDAGEVNDAAVRTRTGQAYEWLLAETFEPARALRTIYRYERSSPPDEVGDAAAPRRLAAIEYGPYRVALRYTSDARRPVPMGDGTLAHDAARLSSIEAVHVESSTVLRVWRLTQERSARTRRWLLTRVEELGYDEQGPLALPSWRFAYGTNDELQVAPLVAETAEPLVVSVTPPTYAGYGLATETLVVAPETISEAADRVRHAAADLNGDARADHVVATWEDATVTLTPFIVRPDGSYQRRAALEIPGVAPLSGTEPLRVGDFDGDGVDELALVSARYEIQYGIPHVAYDVTYVGLSGLSGTLVARPTAPIGVNQVGYPSTVGERDALALGDVDGDGVADMVRVYVVPEPVPNPLQGHVWIDLHRGLAEGGFAAPVPVALRDQRGVFEWRFLGAQRLVPRVASGLFCLATVRTAYAGSLSGETWSGLKAGAECWSVADGNLAIDFEGFEDAAFTDREAVEWQLADFNADGRLDSAFMHRRASGDAVLVDVAYTARSSGVERQHLVHGIRPHEAMGRWTAGDWDGDGRTDLYALQGVGDTCYSPSTPTYASLEGFSSRALPNSPDATLVPGVPGAGFVSWVAPCGTAWAAASAVAVVDHDGDGNKDLVSWAAALPDLTFWPSVRLGPTSARAQAMWRDLDVNGDSVEDLMLVEPLRPSGLRLTTRLRLRDGHLDEPVVQTVLAGVVGVAPAALLAGDATGDGAVDLVLPVQQPDAPVVKLYRLSSRRDGTFEESVTAHSGAWRRDTTARWKLLDQDGDGKKDLVYVAPVTAASREQGCAVWQRSELYTYAATGEGFAPPLSQDQLVTCFAMPGTGGWQVMDVEGDGREDLVSVWSPATLVDGDLRREAHVTVLGARGDGIFRVSASSITDAPPIWPGAWTQADANGDGTTDLVSTAGSRAHLLLGRGDGTFTRRDVEVPGLSGGMANRLRVADWDGDGRSDLVTLRASWTSLEEAKKAECEAAAAAESAACGCQADATPSACFECQDTCLARREACLEADRAHCMDLYAACVADCADDECDGVSELLQTCASCQAAADGYREGCLYGGPGGSPRWPCELEVKQKANECRDLYTSIECDGEGNCTNPQNVQAYNACRAEAEVLDARCRAKHVLPSWDGTAVTVFVAREARPGWSSSSGRTISSRSRHPPRARRCSPTATAMAAPTSSGASGATSAAGWTCGATRGRPGMTS